MNSQAACARIPFCQNKTEQGLYSILATNKWQSEIMQNIHCFSYTGNGDSLKLIVEERQFGCHWELCQDEATVAGSGKLAQKMLVECEAKGMSVALSPYKGVHVGAQVQDATCSFHLSVSRHDVTARSILGCCGCLDDVAQPLELVPSQRERYACHVQEVCLSCRDANPATSVAVRTISREDALWDGSTEPLKWSQHRSFYGAFSSHDTLTSLAVMFMRQREFLSHENFLVVSHAASALIGRPIRKKPGSFKNAIHLPFLSLVYNGGVEF